MIPEAHRRYVDELMERFDVPPLPEDERAGTQYFATTVLRSTPA